MKTASIAKKFFVLFAFAIVAIFSQYALADYSLEIIVPREGDASIIPPNKDFYVLGNINGASKEDNLDLNVKLLDSSGKEIRKLEAHNYSNPSDFYVNYSELSYYAGADRKPLTEALMPDLVYDHNNQKSFSDAWRKTCFNKDNFSALVSGGYYDRDLNLVGKDATKWEPLKEGNYKVLVELIKNDKIVAVTSKDIRVAVSKDVSCFRFSPSEHFAKVKDFSKQHGFKILSDPLAGFWHPADNFANFKNNSVFAEILSKWRWNDLTEYQNNHIHFFIYNVSDTSATNKVEIGTAQAQEIIDNNKRFTSYYYSYGEPVINGAPESKFVKLEDGKHFAFTRIDLNSDGKDNFIDPKQLHASSSILDLNNKELKVKNRFSLSGVVSPIQNNKDRVKLNSDNTYSFDYKLSSVRYTITKGSDKQVIVKKIGLDRILDGKNKNSVYEFEHEFDLEPRFKGNVQLKAEVLTNDNAVYKTESIVLNLNVA